MAQTSIVLSSPADTPLARCIADELGLSLKQYTGHGLGRLLTLCRRCPDAAVLILPDTCRSVWLLRRLCRHGRILLIGHSGGCRIIPYGRRTTLLTDLPATEDLGLWVNTTLLPGMGFEPLATVWEDITQTNTLQKS